MEKKTVIVLSFLILGLFAVSIVSADWLFSVISGRVTLVDTGTYRCSDPDGDLSFDEASYTRTLVISTNKADGTNVTKQDRCNWPLRTKVREAYCDVEGKARRRGVVCDFGCRQGVCQGSYGGNASCRDSDDGKDFYVKGILTNYDGLNYQDYCLDSINLVEKHCLSDDPDIISEQHTCPNGCRDGACLPWDGETGGIFACIQNCLDSDEGDEPTVYGVVGYVNMAGSFIQKDRCASDSFLVEYSCTSDLELTYSTYDCGDLGERYVCEGGRCISGTDKNKVLEVKTISNDTSIPTNSDVEFEDIKSSAKYKAVISSAGVGTASMAGKTYNIKYADDRGIEDDEWVEISGVGIRRQKVFEGAYVVV